MPADQYEGQKDSNNQPNIGGSGSDADRPPRRSKPNVRGQKAREKILSTAARHFSEYGFRGASAAAIAHDAGISEPGLLHHFGSKKGLLKALIERRYSLDQPKLHANEELEGLSLLPLLSTLVRENLKQREAVELAMVMLGESTSAHHPSPSISVIATSKRAKC